MPIEKDTKDWTWVADEPCPECGFDASHYSDSAVGPAVRANAASWPAVLARADARVRPNDSTWSPLEYGAHVRDVLRVYRGRVRLMVETDDPLYPNWDQDETAVEDRYELQDPAVVAVELADSAIDLADALDALTPEQWQRPGRRGDGANFTISRLAKYMTHDIVHHLWDVQV